jgi:hypothetical protein
LFQINILINSPGKPEKLSLSVNEGIYGKRLVRPQVVADALAALPGRDYPPSAPLD